MQKVILFIFLFIILLPQQSKAIEPYIYANSAILIDADSGVILFEQDINKQNEIASITKLMNAYIIMDEMNAGTINWNDEIKPSAKAIAISQNSLLSNVPLYNNKKYTVEELFNATIIASANGAAIALAEYVSGSEEEHVQKMNDKAKKLGLKNTTFVNVTGLEASDYNGQAIHSNNEKNISTAKDIAYLGKKIIEDYSEILEISSKSTIDWYGDKVDNYNLMVPNLYMEYPGVKGLKTGSTPSAGYSFLGYITINNENYISVVLGATSTTNRFFETAKIYDWIQDVEMTTILKESLKKEKNIKNSKIGKETLYIKDDYQIINVQKSANYYVKEIQYNDQYFKKNKLIKNVPANELVGTITLVSSNNDILGSSVNAENGQLKIDVYTESEIKVKGILRSIIKNQIN